MNLFPVAPARWASLLFVCGFLLSSGPVHAQPRITGISKGTSVDEGQQHQFTVNTADASGADLVYKWDFGDGSEPITGRAASVGHRYADDGQYSIEVTMYGADGVLDQTTRSVTVQNVDPTVIRLLYGDGATAERSVDVRVEARDPGDDDLTYTWDFGDGTTRDTKRRPAVSHIYDDPGLYTVTVRVADGDGGTTTATREVLVGTDFSLRYSGYLERNLTGITYDYFTQRDSVRVLPGGGWVDCTVLFRLNPDTEEIRRVDAPIHVQIIGPFDEGTYPIAPVTGQRDGSRRTAYLYHKWTFVEGDEWVNVDPERATGTLEITSFRGPSAVNPGIDGALSANLITRINEPGNSRNPPLQVDGTFSVTLTSADVPPECFDDRTAPLQVTDHTPRTNAQNIHRTDPTIEVTFSDPVDNSTLTDASAYLQYLKPDSSHQRVSVAKTVSGSTVRLVPYDDLLPGVTYDAVLEGGETGIRGDDDEIMEDRYTWSFSTLIEPDSINVHLFQVARDAPLVPGKSTLTRVYTYWSERDDVHPSDQVEQFGARIRVLDDAGGELYTTKSRVLERPDGFDDYEKRRALNSVNFFGWNPDRDQTDVVRAEIEPVNQESGREAVTFTGAQNASYWDRSPSLSIEYYILPLGELEAADGPLERVYKNRVRHLAARAADFTTQNFPIVDVDVLGPHLPEIGTAGLKKGFAAFRQQLQETGQFDPASGEHTRLMKYLQQEIGPHSSADIVVFMVPTDVLNFPSGQTYTGVSSSSDRTDTSPYAGLDWIETPLVTMQLHKVVPVTASLTHEFGHVYGLQHLPFFTNDPERVEICGRSFGDLPAAAKDIEGFRIAPDGRSGWNKSKTEGNEQNARLYPLMFPCAGGWVTPPLYREGQFITNDQYDRLMDGLERGWTADSGTGSSTIWHTRSNEHARPSQSLSPLGSTPRGPAAPERYDASHSGRSSPLSFTSPTPNQTVRGALTVQWTDAAPDSAGYTLLYSPTGSAPWSVRGIGLQSSEHEVQADGLRPGPKPTLRVVSNERDVSARVAFQLDRDLAIGRTWPFDGDSVSVQSAVFVELDTDLDAGSLTGLNLSVAPADSPPVDGDLSYDDRKRRIRFTPAKPLDAQTTYTATLSAGLVDRYGHELSEALTWSFHTTEHDSVSTRSEPSDAASSPDASTETKQSEDSEETGRPDERAEDDDRRGRFGRFLQRMKDRVEEAKEAAEETEDDSQRK